MDSLLNSAAAVFHQMNPLDWLIALSLAVSTTAAFLRGLIRSLVSLGGVFLGILLACLYAHRTGTVLSRWVGSSALADVAGFVLILAGVIMIAALIGRALRGVVSAVGLGFFDRLAGACFGFLRGVLVLAALLLPLAPLIRPLPVTQTSLLLPYLLPAAHGISFVVPRDFGKRLPAGDWLHHARTATGQFDASPSARRHLTRGEFE